MSFLETKFHLGKEKEVSSFGFLFFTFLCDLRLADLKLLSMALINIYQTFQIKLFSLLFKNRCLKASEVTVNTFSPLSSLLALLRDLCSLETHVTQRLDEGGEEFQEE